jgi:hypothetical protein
MRSQFKPDKRVLLVCCRLALARVSVLRGSGPAAGTAFIDDYVACVEPVVDYLTRWSGIRPGDLTHISKGMGEAGTFFVDASGTSAAPVSVGATENLCDQTAAPHSLMTTWLAWSLWWTTSLGGAAFGQVRGWVGDSRGRCTYFVCTGGSSAALGFVKAEEEYVGLCADSFERRRCGRLHGLRGACG